MKLRTLKILVFISAGLHTVAGFLAFQAAPYLGTIYLAMVKTTGSNLPRLTSDFSLPMLRVDPSVPLQFPQTLWWATMIWGLVIFAPIYIMFWSLKTETFQECHARWGGGMFIYLPIILILLVTVLSGLLISLAPFPNMQIR